MLIFEVRLKLSAAPASAHQQSEFNNHHSSISSSAFIRVSLLYIIASAKLSSRHASPTLKTEKSRKNFIASGESIPIIFRRDLDV